MIRPTRKEDAKQIIEIVRQTNVFNDEEIAIAQELLDIYLNDFEQQDYEIFSYVDEREKVLGYVCIGPTPATQGTYDMYWIATSPDVHNKGIGTQLLQFTEEYLKKKNALRNTTVAIHRRVFKKEKCATSYCRNIINAKVCINTRVLY